MIPALLRATELDLSGQVTYQTNSDRTTVVLTAERISNLNVNRSGTVRLELWATASPISLASGFSGYKLAVHSIGTLAGNSSFTNISSGTIRYSSPPSGQSWYITLVVTEFTGTPINNGYTARDEISFGSQNSGGGTTSNTAWPTPSGTVQDPEWTPQAGDRLTLEIREINGTIVPVGTVITYILETSTRFRAEGGSTTSDNPQADYTHSPSSDLLDGRNENCLLLTYDYSPYANDPSARGDKSLFFYTANSGVFDGFDQDASGSGTARGIFTIERNNNPDPSTNRWRNSAPTGGNSYFDANLGFYFTDSNSDWIYTALMGWLYPVGDYSPDLWCYSVGQNNWLYTTASLSAWHFRLQDNRWYFYDAATNALF